MTTNRPSRARKAALTAGEAPEAPGTAPDAAPGSGQEGPEALPGAAPEPALDETGRYDFGAHRRRVMETPWPPFADAPVVFAADARAAIDKYDAGVDRAVNAALDETARAYQDGVKRANERLNAWLQMRARRFPAHAA